MYNPNFVDRVDEAKLFKDSFNKKEKHIDVYGTIGVGKTQLINHLYPICEENYLYIPILLQKVLTLEKFLETIALKIEEITDDGKLLYQFIDYLSEEKKYGREPDQETVVFLFSEAFRKFLESRKDQKVLLFFDNTEKVSEKIWEKFQLDVLEYQLKITREPKPKVRFITSGRKRLHWWLPEIRNRVFTCSLKLFTKADGTDKMVLKLAEQKGIKFENEISALETIHQLTLGHPESIAILVDHLTEDHCLLLDGYDVKRRYEEGVAVLMEQLVKQKFVYKFEKLTRKEKDYPFSGTCVSLFQSLAPLRFISSKILLETLYRLPSFSSLYSNQQLELASRRLFHTLQEEHFIDRNEDKERYEFPEIVRHILLEDLQLRDYETLIKLHQEMAIMCRRMIEQNFVDRNLYFVERLYHIVSWQKVERDKGGKLYDLEETVRSEVKQYFREFGEDKASLRSLLEADDYLKNITNWKKFFRSLKK